MYQKNNSQSKHSIRLAAAKHAGAQTKARHFTLAEAVVFLLGDLWFSSIKVFLRGTDFQVWIWIRMFIRFFESPSFVFPGFASGDFFCFKGLTKVPFRDLFIYFF